MKLSDLHTLGLCEFVELFEPGLTHQEKELFKLIENGAFKFDIHYLAQTETKITALVALWNLCSFKETQTALLVPFNSNCKQNILAQCCSYLGRIELGPKTRLETESNKITLNRSAIYVLDDGFSESRLATLMAGVFCDHYIFMAVDADNLKPEHVKIASSSVTQKNWQCILARKVEETQPVNFFHQSAIRDLLERGFYEAAYKESKLSWHPVDMNLPIEEIVKQSDDKFMEDARLFYINNQKAIFDQIDPVHSSMFLRHLQYEFQINKIRNTYLDILRETIEKSIHKGYMFTINLSKQIDSDNDPRRGITAIDIEPTQEDISKLSQVMKESACSSIAVPSRLIREVSPSTRIYPAMIKQMHGFDIGITEEQIVEVDRHLLSDRKIEGLSSIPSKTNDLPQAFVNAFFYTDIQNKDKTDE